MGFKVSEADERLLNLWERILDLPESEFNRVTGETAKYPKPISARDLIDAVRNVHSPMIFRDLGFTDTELGYD